MEKNESFNSAAKTYDESRPSYPKEVIDWIISKTNISKGEKLLEIGPGTGQATIKFAERGYNVHCIEMGENLADILMQKTKNYNVSVDVSTFEAWEPRIPIKTPFIFSATAFHWIDQSVKYRKCYDLLDDNGFLVLLWNVAPEVDIPEVKRAFDLLWQNYPEKRKEVKTDIRKQTKIEIANSGLFTLVDYIDYKWKLKQTRERFTKNFFSQSSFLSLEHEKQKVIEANVEELFKCLHDEFDTDYYTTVYIAKKKTV